MVQTKAEYLFIIATHSYFLVRIFAVTYTPLPVYLRGHFRDLCKCSRFFLTTTVPFRQIALSYISLTRLVGLKTRPNDCAQTSQISLWKVDSIREQQGRTGPSFPQVLKQHMTHSLGAEEVAQPYIIHGTRIT